LKTIILLLKVYKKDLFWCVGAIPFYSIVLLQATRPIQEKKQIEQVDRKNSKEKCDKKHRQHKTHSKSNLVKKRAYMHIYTTRSDFAKALLQHAMSDFLALIIRVSKLSKPVNSSILVTL